jgi:hypothetical protein
LVVLAVASFSVSVASLEDFGSSQFLQPSRFVALVQLPPVKEVFSGLGFWPMNHSALTPVRSSFDFLCAKLACRARDFFSPGLIRSLASFLPPSSLFFFGRAVPSSSVIVISLISSFL